MSDDDAALASPFILWVNYGSYEGWKPYGYATLDEAQRDIAAGGRGVGLGCIVTGAVLFPPKKENAT